MNDPNAVFEQEIGLLKVQAAATAYDRCTHIATDHTRFFSIGVVPNGVYVNELLDYVFGELNSLFEGYDLSNDKTNEINSHVVQRLQAILEGFKSNNDEKLFLAVRDLRVYMTKLQLSVWYSTGTKERETAVRRFVTRG